MNIDNKQTGHSNALHTAQAHAQSVAGNLQSLTQNQQEIYSAVPQTPSELHVHMRAILKAFSKQTHQLLNTPSSSNNSHLLALKILEERNFDSAPNSTLRIPLSGHALGGFPQTKKNISARDARFEKHIEICGKISKIEQKIKIAEEQLPSLRAQLEKITSTNYADTETQLLVQSLMKSITEHETFLNQAPSILMPLQTEKETSQSDLEHPQKSTRQKKFK